MNDFVYQKVDKYIRKVISEACISENRPNDVRYQFCIIEDNVVFVMKTKYLKVKSRIEYRLQKNLIKNFNLKFNKDFYLYEGIDINFSIVRWDIFGNFATIRCGYSKIHLLPPYTGQEGEFIPSKHVEELMKLYRINNISFDTKWERYEGEDGWERYLQDYSKIYNKKLEIDIITC